MRLNKLLAGLLLGLALGAGAERLWLKTHDRHRLPDPQRVAEKLGDKLQLDASQREAVKKIVETYRDRVAAARQHTSAQINEIRESVRNDIRKLLNDAQKKTFEDLVAKADERRKKSADDD